MELSYNNQTELKRISNKNMRKQDEASTYV